MHANNFRYGFSAGNPLKITLMQFAINDQTGPNPTFSAMAEGSEPRPFRVPLKALSSLGELITQSYIKK